MNQRFFTRLSRGLSYIFARRDLEEPLPKQWKITPCIFCQRPIFVGSSFCSNCGAAQQERHTTGAQALVKPAPMTTTGMIKLYRRPNERPINTLARMSRPSRKRKEVKQ